MSVTQGELNRRFDYHPPDEDTREVHTEVRRLTKEFAGKLVELTTEGREQSLMLTALEEAQMWAHADIARNQHPH
jgi:hypothetical protein